MATERSCGSVEHRCDMPRRSHDLVNVIICAAINGTGKQCFSPHLFVGYAMSADESHHVELRCQGAKLAVIREIEVKDDDLGSVTMNDLPDLVHIASDADIPEIPMELSR